MPKLIIVNDGKVIEGKTLKDIVKYMKRRDATLPNSVREYMTRTKDRVKLITDKDIDITNVDTFFESLERIGLIEMLYD